MKLPQPRAKPAEREPCQVTCPQGPEGKPGPQVSQSSVDFLCTTKNLTFTLVIHIDPLSRVGQGEPETGENEDHRGELDLQESRASKVFQGLLEK